MRTDGEAWSALSEGLVGTRQRPFVGHINKCSPVELLDETGPRRVVGEG